nr:hypothetical transcript [Hymenolepis microstoma]
MRPKLVKQAIPQQKLRNFRALMHRAMKESLTVPRPALVDDFLENLMSGAREDTERKAITFDTDHLNEVIQNIANNVMRMQREAYER